MCISKWRYGSRIGAQVYEFVKYLKPRSEKRDVVPSHLPAVASSRAVARIETVVDERRGCAKTT